MDSTGRFVATTGDRQIRVFHNIAGRQIADLSVDRMRWIRRIERIDR
jgi:hypothetical protein